MAMQNYEQGEVRSNRAGSKGSSRGAGSPPSCNNVGDPCTWGYDSTGGWIDCTPNGGTCTCNLNCVANEFAYCNGPGLVCNQSGGVDTSCDYFCGGGGGHVKPGMRRWPKEQGPPVR